MHLHKSSNLPEKISLVDRRGPRPFNRAPLVGFWLSDIGRYCTLCVRSAHTGAEVCDVPCPALQVSRLALLSPLVTFPRSSGRQRSLGCEEGKWGSWLLLLLPLLPLLTPALP
ncbi:hypothetical protein F5144DRAFT_559707 [Chaetomium tenue]|uniref:Uncharacterized protein n=1 Tax=Chaetomium tenue TaxID=1854479 RepID=A0ACB7PE76_9PEZI|nr:hypothetical protein F5144DRAFT_559707 [Chaetomium globosum]